MTTALQMQLDELPTAILSVGGVCGKPRQIAQRLTASRDRKHASAREKEERQTQLNKWANHRDKAGHASFRMLRQQVTRHSGGFLANFSLMKMLEEPALGSLPRKQWTWLLRWHQLSRRQVFASFSQELWMRGEQIGS